MSSKPTDVRLRMPDRSQMAMQVASADDLVSAGHPVRLIWEVTGRLDLAAFYAPVKARVGEVGRNATDPRLLVALWLYAVTRGVGSARELARLCVESDPYRWLCGGVTLNHHTLSDFRVGHAAALDELFTRVIATLADKGVIKVTRISQDGTRVRACAGASSFRRGERLGLLLEQARAHVAELKSLLDDPQRSAGLSAKRRAARVRAARERQERVERAMAQLPELAARQAKLARKVSKKDKAKGKLKEPRASTTDPEARVMKMPDGGFRPAVNVQLATDTASRAVVGVEVSNLGVDTAQAEPMRQQVERRTGRKVQEHLIDGGYLVHAEIERAHDRQVTLYVPPKPPRNPELRGSEYEPRPDDSDVLKQWRARMGSDAGKAVYKERASTSETVNADLKSHRGLVQLTVRGLPKARCVALWCALAYNLMHFAPSLLG
ncbi:MAG: IS1182 family transposase [Tepidisphaeraceae bacterium]